MHASRSFKFTARNFDPIAYINEPRWQKVSLGLDRAARLMTLLGDPHLQFKVIHVAGTNGKGSVCAYVASILQASGNKVGLFTSPYIERFEERIKVDSQDIEYSALLECTLEVKMAAETVECELGEHPTEFELMFAVAMLYFARTGIDVAVVEVGLGGRLDATNVVLPELCIITSISLDHTAILGDSIGLIANEKAGIIKPGVPVISWPQNEEAMDIIAERCLEHGSELIRLNLDDVTPLTLDIHDGLQSFSYKSDMYQTQLLGSYQPYNASLAILSVQFLAKSDPSLTIDAPAIYFGIKETKWPGRFEVIHHHPLIIVDGAHNPQGTYALADTLGRVFHDDKEDARDYADCLDHSNNSSCANVVFVMGVLADKDYKEMILPLLPFAKAFVTYSPNNPRALGASDLTATIVQISQREGYSIRVESASDVTEAMAQALRAATTDLSQNSPHKKSPENIIVAFGTLYSVAEIKHSVRLLSIT